MYKKKILFVCLGNICRSPMAEFIMKKMVKEARLEEQYEIASAATSTDEIGNPVYPPARQKLAENGIGCQGKTARQMTRKDYEYYDFVIAMEQKNLKHIRFIIGEDDQNKLSLLMDYTDHPHDVADPWYTGNFNITWNDLNEGCTALLRTLESR
ncbi:MAG: low molecular weight phosphotyrosine protein phosphatase [Bacteroidales bacterium]|nr:low molecular weight phosphotyrosine protein phosphatase [Bacteroidales bacterium]